MNEILKILINRNLERKILNVDDIKKICQIVIRHNKYDFVTDVEVYKSYVNNEDTAGVYYKNQIYYFYDKIIELIEDCANQITNNHQLDGCIVDLYNYYFLTLIFHELAHARQHYLITSDNYSVEKKLFSFFESINRDRDFYHENYHDVLNEVNAINVSHMTATYFYSKLPSNIVNQNDSIIYQTILLSRLLYSNYAIVPTKELVFSPSERVASKFTLDMLDDANMSIEEYNRLLLDNNFTLYKKLMMGLPISYMEYAYANLLKGILDSGTNINVSKKLQKRINE